MFFKGKFTLLIIYLSHLLYFYLFQDIRRKLYALLHRLGGTKKDIKAAYRSIIYNINGHHAGKNVYSTLNVSLN